MISNLERTFNTNFQGMTREVYTALGQANGKFDAVILGQTEMKTALNSFKAEVSADMSEMNERVSRSEEQILQLNRALFGDSRVTASPFVRKDIDRHESEIIGLNQTVRQINGDLKGVRDMLSEFVGRFNDFLLGYDADMKIVVAFTRITKLSQKAIPTIIKFMSDQRWSFILPTSAVIGAIASIVIEILKALSLVP